MQRLSCGAFNCQTLVTKRTRKHHLSEVLYHNKSILTFQKHSSEYCSALTVTDIHRILVQCNIVMVVTTVCLVYCVVVIRVDTIRGMEDGCSKTSFRVFAFSQLPP